MAQKLTQQRLYLGTYPEHLAKCNCGCGQKRNYRKYHVYEGEVLWFNDELHFRDWLDGQQPLELTDISPIGGFA